VSAIPISKISDLQYGGLYLPSASYGYLFLEYRDQYTVLDLFIFKANVLLIASFLALFGAVLVHTVMKATLGRPTGEPRFIGQSTLIQRVLYVLFSEGRPSYYPKSISLEGFNNSRLEDIDITRKRWILFVLVAISIVSLAFSYFYSGWLLLLELDRLGLVGGVLAFSQAAWVLQVTMSDWWPNSYSLDYREQPSIATEIEEFTQFLYRYDKIGRFEWEYFPEDSVFQFRYETHANSSSDEEEIFKILLIGYSATIAQSEYYCEEMIAEVIDDGEKQAVFSIKSEDVEHLEKKNIDHALTSILDSIEYK
jgi:general stress protein CsbA